MNIVWFKNVKVLSITCYLNCFFRKIVSNNTVNGMIASFVICKIIIPKGKISTSRMNDSEDNIRVNITYLYIKFNMILLCSSKILRWNLVESNGIKAKTQVEKSNGDAIQNTEKHDCFEVNGFGDEQIQALSRMKGAKRDHQMPTSKCCGWSKSNKIIS